MAKIYFLPTRDIFTTYYCIEASFRESMSFSPSSLHLRVQTKSWQGMNMMSNKEYKNTASTYQAQSDWKTSRLPLR